MPVSRGWVVIAMALASCSRERKAPVPVAPDSASAPPAASAPASARPGASSAASSAASAAASSRAVSPEEMAKRRAYVDGLARGRKASVARDWPQAIAWFDAAIKAEPTEGRAYAERGYARLLSGDTENASSDFDKAAGLTNDRRLLGQIWFNRGLVDEKRGWSDNALADFAVSNRLNSTSAARKKLGDKDPCLAVVSDAPRCGMDKVDPTGSDWLAFLNDAMAGNPHMEPMPKDAAEARKALTALDADPTGPVVAVVGQPGAGQTAYLVVRRGTQLRGACLGAEIGGRCPGQVSFDVAATAGTRVHVHGTELAESGYAYMCIFPDGDVHPCGDGQMNDPDVTTQSFCAGNPSTERDLVVDTASMHVLLTVERPVLPDDGTDAGVAIRATMVPAGLKLEALGCDRTVPWPPDAGP
jgi:hypothetical protein